jgi:hypothetical protein
MIVTFISKEVPELADIHAQVLPRDSLHNPHQLPLAKEKRKRAATLIADSTDNSLNSLRFLSASTDRDKVQP